MRRHGSGRHLVGYFAPGLHPVQAQRLGECIDVAIELRHEFDSGHALPAMIEVMFQRGFESQLVQCNGAQLADEIAHNDVEMVGVANDGACSPKDGRRAIGHFLLDRHRVGLDRIEILTQLIVQLTGEKLPLRFLRPQVLPRQLAILE